MRKLSTRIMAGCLIRKAVMSERFFPSTSPGFHADKRRTPFALRPEWVCPGCRHAGTPTLLAKTPERRSSESRRRGTPGEGKRLRTASRTGRSRHCGLKQEKNLPPLRRRSVEGRKSRVAGKDSGPQRSNSSIRELWGVTPLGRLQSSGSGENRKQHFGQERLLATPRF